MWTFLAVLAVASAQPGFKLETLGGDVIAGPILRISAEEVTVKTPDGPVRIGVEQLSGLVPAAALPPTQGQPRVWVDLVDGSSLLAADYAAAEGRARITAFDGQLLDLATDDVAAVRFQPQDDAVAAEWARLLDARHDTDLLVIRTDGAVDYHHGVIGEVTEALVRFALEGDLLPVKRSKVHGLIYHRPAGREFSEAACRVLDVDGSRWVAGSIELDGGSLRWTTLSGLVLARPLSAIARVDFSQGKVVYLSDLEPESVEWTPFFGSDARLEAMSRFFGPREDQGLRSGPLELEGKQYQKGLALHSRTSIVYRLPGDFRRFKAIVGIDDRVRPRGTARLLIHGDQRVLLETTIAGTNPPMSIDLDLTGVRRLGILVDFGDDLDVADHVDLCEARVVK